MDTDLICIQKKKKHVLDSEYFKRKRICIAPYCKKIFKEMENICKFECGYHWGYYVKGEYKGEWTCCGDENELSSKNPCIRHDHYDKETKIHSYPNLSLDIDLYKNDTELSKILNKRINEILKNNGSFINIKDNKIICKRK